MCRKCLQKNRQIQNLNLDQSNHKVRGVQHPLFQIIGNCNNHLQGEMEASMEASHAYRGVKEADFYPWSAIN